MMGYHAMRWLRTDIELKKHSPKSESTFHIASTRSRLTIDEKRRCGATSEPQSSSWLRVELHHPSSYYLTAHSGRLRAEKV